ncbi:uncharacterized protein LOC120271811 [Dioscorea cayenensis subsp. rotundata]|uniref:Uncharacterized protein LOC120271811 n=1 Tax=Dioscorea cayennensis subsp. rotundata TaxID=55577 RepID=A0AB40C3P8_DIOCR|nr:uncharacterized protein LOC120271811 [Dioscorea cayenensis subsp. rotundata]
MAVEEEGLRPWWRTWRRRSSSYGRSTTPLPAGTTSSSATLPLVFPLLSCGRHVSIDPVPFLYGVTGAVMWDSGVVVGKFLEHAVDVGELSLNGKKVVKLGSKCGLVSCVGWGCDSHSSS